MRESMKNFSIIPYEVYCDDFEETVIVYAKYQIIPNGVPNAKFCSVECPQSRHCKFSITGQCSISSQIPDVIQI